MSFVSINFAFFVLACVLVYYIVPKKYRYIVLLGFSYAFYLCIGIKYITYILVTTLSTFVLGLYINKLGTEQKIYIKENKETLTKEEKKAYKAGVKRKQRLALVVCLLLNFGILLYLKYVDFTIAYLNLFRLHYFGVTDFIPFKNVILPLGISFYTFISMGYLIDIYYGKYEASKNPFKFALFVSFFPQIIQGPICRYSESGEQLSQGHDFDVYNIKSGLIRILWGLFKKLIIADRVASFVSTTMELKDSYQGLYIILAVFLYSMQIYGDFSGGIDITLGVSELFGIKLPENFERPFFSKSISEYWRRWHITLGTWFKDYIFYPLSLNKGILKLGKWCREHINDGFGKRVPLYLPMVIVWATTGMWHGSESRYVVWGLLNCVFIMIGTEMEPVSEKIVNRFSLDESKLYMKLYRAGKTFWLMAFLRLFDISKSPADAFLAFKYAFLNWRMFNINEVYTTLKLPYEDLIVVIIALLVVLCVSLVQRSGAIRARILNKSSLVWWSISTALLVAVLIYGYYGPGYDSQAFIYLQF